MQKTKLEMTGGRERGHVVQLRRGAQLDILIVMNRPRYRGAITAFRPPTRPLLCSQAVPPSLARSLRAEFVSHTSRRQNSWGIPNNADDDDDDGAADEMFLLPIITHGEAKEKRAGERGERTAK